MSQTEQKSEDGQVAHLTALAANAAQVLQQASERRSKRMESLTEQVRNLTAHNGDLEDRLAALQRDLDDEREARASDAEVAAARIEALQNSLDAAENRVLVLQGDLSVMTAKFSSAAAEFEQFVGTVRSMSEQEGEGEREDVTARSRVRFVEEERPAAAPVADTPSLRIVPASRPAFEVPVTLGLEANDPAMSAVEELRGVSDGFSSLIQRSAAAGGR